MLIESLSGSYMEDISLITDFLVISNCSFKTRILAASIRSVNHMTQAVPIGAEFYALYQDNGRSCAN